MNCIRVAFDSSDDEKRRLQKVDRTNKIEITLYIYTGKLSLKAKKSFQFFKNKKTFN